MSTIDKIFDKKDKKKFISRLKKMREEVMAMEKKAEKEVEKSRKKLNKSQEYQQASEKHKSNARKKLKEAKKLQLEIIDIGSFMLDKHYRAYLSRSAKSSGINLDEADIVEAIFRHLKINK